MHWVCPCGNGTMGQQVCGPDGVYGQCDCSGDGGAVDGGRSDGAPADGAQRDGPAQTDGFEQADAPQSDVLPPSDALQSDAPPPVACVAGTEDQQFAQGMRGCKGTVTFANRASLCTASFRVCTAAEWVARHGAVAPTYNYWTNDVLYAAGGDQSCAVDTVQHYGDWCDGTNPMRVCVAHTDSLGNLCNWIGCGFNAITPSEYFGGCQNNPTAGALCCPS
jgi:hypothetical protein